MRETIQNKEKQFHAISLSGGKDSTAMLLLMIERGMPINSTDTEVNNVEKLIAVTRKYTRIDELTPEILNAFVDKIVVHEKM